MPIEETDEYYRYRLRDPERYEKMRTLAFGEGIKAVWGCPKGSMKDGECVKGKGEIQSILCDKDKFTKSECVKWVKEHPKIRLRRRRK